MHWSDHTIFNAYLLYDSSRVKTQGNGNRGESSTENNDEVADCMATTRVVEVGDDTRRRFKRGSLKQSFHISSDACRVFCKMRVEWLGGFWAIPRSSAMNVKKGGNALSPTGRI